MRSRRDRVRRFGLSSDIDWGPPVTGRAGLGNVLQMAFDGGCHEEAGPSSAGGRQMRVGFVQYEPVFGEVAANLSAIESAVEAAGRADLMVLPELATTGYNFASVEEADALSEPVPGPSTERLAVLSKRLETWLVVGIAEAAGGRRYNSSVLIGPSGWVG